MSTVSDICDTIGRKELGARLGVSKAAIANAVADGKFPSRWYLVVTAMCEERGVLCPDELFSFVCEDQNRNLFASAPAREAS